jgi:Na+/H+-dicarboxylate symporter
LVSLVPLIGLLSVPFAVVGLGLGIAGIRRAGRGSGGRGMAISGLITCAAALLISALYVWAFSDEFVHLDEIDTDPPNGVCNEDRYMQDPDC